MTDDYPDRTPEFIQARIDQWEGTKAVAEADLDHANRRIEYWEAQK